MIILAAASSESHLLEEPAQLDAPEWILVSETDLRS